MDQLQSIWNEAGYEEQECQGLLGDLYSKIKLLYSSEISSENRILELARDQVLQRYGLLRELHSKVGKPFETDIASLGVNCMYDISYLLI